MKVLPRTKFGNPILRKKAKRVSKKKILEPEFQYFIKRMQYTMKRAQGVGLAAPQVDESVALATVDIPPIERLKGEEPVRKLVLINPKITHHSKEMTEGWEGCLSLPGLFGRVPRHQKVTVEYLDENAEKHVQEFEGFPAAVVQHEIDHLEGVLFTDRMIDMSTLMYAEEYFKHHAKKK